MMERMSYEPDLRRQRATHMSHIVLRAMHPWIDMRDEMAAYYRLFDLFMELGIDVVTDHDRELAGLPPRGEKGWTKQELSIIENQRLLALLQPMKVVSITVDPVLREPDKNTPRT